MPHLRLRGIIDGFQHKRVGVIGDLMLDRYIWGGAERISQEAPVPVVRVTRRTSAPGGAANVLRNVIELGGQATAFGVVGEDNAGRDLLAELDTLGVVTNGVVPRDDRLTTEKTRVIAEHQQVVRVDSEDDSPLGTEAWDDLFARVESALQAHKLDALIVEDYAKGVLTPERISALADLGRNHDVPVALDPHPSNPRPSHGLSIMTPNRAEAFTLAGISEKRRVRVPFADDQSLHDMASELLAAWKPDALLITLGPDGMALFRSTAEPVHIPTHAREVYDVSGAGDTVIATYVLAGLGGATPYEAIDLANRAAGVVVAKLGTAPITREEIEYACSGEEA